MLIEKHTAFAVMARTQGDTFNGLKVPLNAHHSLLNILPL